MSSIESAGQSPIAGRGDIVDFVGTHARFRPGKLACVDLESGRHLTYAQLDQRIACCAAFLVRALGDPRGQRVALLARNGSDTVVAQFACERVGAMLVPFNWRLAPAELEALMRDAAPRILIYEAEFEAAALHGAAAVQGVLVLRIAPGQDEFAAALEAETVRADPGIVRLLDGDAPITLLYTSGTSGKPKGVILTGRSAFYSTLNFSVASQATQHSVFLCDSPMFHVIGILAALRTPLFQGGTVLLSPRFDAGVALKRLADKALAITHIFSVPQVAQMLRERPEFDPAACKGLAAVFVGGAPNPPVAVRRWLADGIAMIDGFGMTETGSAFSMPLSDLDMVARKAGSVGVPLPSVQVRLVDAEGRDVADGAVGELWLRGPNITPGYWNQPEATSRAFEDGWLKSGDLASRDADGFYYLVDRLKDMYISGGENVYPAEVEAAIHEVPGISEVAVIGVPDARWGEVGCAYVVALPGTVVTADTVLAYLNTQLARYKIPKTVVVTEQIPRTATGKVQKAILRQRHVSG